MITETVQQPTETSLWDVVNAILDEHVIHTAPTQWDALRRAILEAERPSEPTDEGDARSFVIDVELLTESMRAVRSDKGNISPDGRWDADLDDEAQQIATEYARLAAAPEPTDP